MTDRMDQSLLYIITEGENGPVKIGIAKRPGFRMKELQTGNARQLDLYWCRPFENTTFARIAEQRVHRDLQKHRMVGEWFALGPVRAAALVEAAL